MLCVGLARGWQGWAGSSEGRASLWQCLGGFQPLWVLLTSPVCGCAGGLRAAHAPLIPGQLWFPFPSVATSQSPLGNGSWQELADAVPRHQHGQGSSGASSSSVAMGD